MLCREWCNESPHVYHSALIISLLPVWKTSVWMMAELAQKYGKILKCPGIIESLNWDKEVDSEAGVYVGTNPSSVVAQTLGFKGPQVRGTGGTGSQIRNPWKMTSSLSEKRLHPHKGRWWTYVSGLALALCGKGKKENIFSWEFLTTASLCVDLGPEILGGPKRFQAENLVSQAGANKYIYPPFLEECTWKPNFKYSPRQSSKEDELTIKNHKIYGDLNYHEN